AETPGRWRYAAAGGGTARFEAPGGAMLFALRCDKARHIVTLLRPDAPNSAALTVTTSYGSRTLSALPGQGASLPAADTLLDQIAFSRGRFTIDAAGMAELVLPAWAEPARVIEDCRG
ncbi:hypothetical protein, partial [Sphingomonas bacterium]|uniref:hypothetical protein n=1 Tax=Sphingomonas bacterium TaxID=1895847 RepID=UPI001575E4FA